MYTLLPPKGVSPSESTNQLLAQIQERIAREPSVPDNFNYLGELHRHLGEWDLAVAAYLHAAVLQPNFAEAHNNRGIALDMAQRRKDAEEAIRLALFYRAHFPKAWNNLGILLGLEGRSEEAIACFSQSLEQDPANDVARGNLANLLSMYGETENAIKWYRQILSANDPNMHSNFLLSLHYAGDYDPAVVLTESKAWAQKYAVPLAGMIKPHANDRNPERTLRVGFTSPDFVTHPVGQFFDVLFTHFDRTQVQAYAYCDAPLPDAHTERLKAKADHWRNVVGVQPHELADMIRSDQIDILVDTTGHTGNNRLLMLAQKPAPIQIEHFGYPDTTGMSTMDYRISDAVADPPGTDQYYVEKLLRLPRFAWCYRKPEGTPEPGPLPLDRNGYLTLGSLNNFSKVNHRTWNLWLDLLEKLPTARLLLLVNKGRAVNQRLFREAKDRGIKEDRLILRERGKPSEYFHFFHEVDIALDPYPYHGGVTSCDTLWMGVPLLSQVGPTYFCRQGLAMLRHVGLEDFAVADEEAFRAKVLALADDPSVLRQLRQELRGRLLESPMMDNVGFVRELTAAYRDVWRLWTKGTT